MTDMTNELGLTDEQFIAQYVEKAKDSIESADDWVKELAGGAPSTEFVARLAPEVLKQLAEAGVLTVQQEAPEATEESTPSDGITQEENASPEAVQELVEASTEQ